MHLGGKRLLTVSGGKLTLPNHGTRRLKVVRRHLSAIASIPRRRYSTHFFKAMPFSVRQSYLRPAPAPAGSLRDGAVRCSRPAADSCGLRTQYLWQTASGSAREALSTWTTCSCAAYAGLLAPTADSTRSNAFAAWCNSSWLGRCPWQAEVDSYAQLWARPTVSDNIY